MAPAPVRFIRGFLIGALLAVMFLTVTGTVSLTLDVLGRALGG